MSGLHIKSLEEIMLEKRLRKAMEEEEANGAGPRAKRPREGEIQLARKSTTNVRCNAEE